MGKRMSYTISYMFFMLTMIMGVLGLFMFVTEGYTPTLERLGIALATTTAVTFVFGIGIDR